MAAMGIWIGVVSAPLAFGAVTASMALIAAKLGRL